MVSWAEFEDDEYTKTLVTVQVPGTPGRSVQAMVYAYAYAKEHLADHAWDYERFCQDALPEYRVMCKVFMAELSKYWEPPTD